MVEYEGSMRSVEKKEHYVVKGLSDQNTAILTFSPEVLVPENIGISRKCENGKKGHTFAMLRFKVRPS